MTEGRRRAFLICAALFGLSALLYLPSLGYGFVEYDDVRIVLDHPKLYDEHSFLAALREIFVGYFPREEPLLVRDMTWALNSRLFGFKNGLGYHLGNVLLNAANAPLLFLFLARATKRVPFAAVVATLFAVAPVHVEAVCWVMGRKDVLCAFFSLLVLLVEAEAFQMPARRRALRTLGFVLYVLAVLSKTSAITLVFVVAAYRMLALDLSASVSSPPPRERPTSLLALTPHLLVSIGCYLWYSRVLHEWGLLNAAHSAFGTQLSVMLRYIPLSIGLYLKSLFALTDYSLIYLWPDSAIPLTASENAIAFAVAAALVAFLVWAALRRRDLLFYGLAFFAVMLPYMHSVDLIRWRADRYLYLSSFCIFAIVAQLATDLFARGSVMLRRVVIGAAAVWALSAAFVTLTNEPRFHDDHALWSYEVGLPIPSMTAYAQLASSYVNLARHEHDPAQREKLAAEAERVAQSGIRYYASIPWRADMAPKLDYAKLYVQLGFVSSLRGEPVAAQLGHYEASYRIIPMESNMLFLAQSLYKIALASHDEELARKSLRLYGELVAKQSADTARREVTTHVLDMYRQSFPTLGAEIDALEKAYLQ